VESLRLADFGFVEGINEIIAITRNADESWNTAPMGVIVEDSSSTSAKVRLYRSHTRENVKREGVMYANIVWDAEIFAIASFDDLGESFFESLNPPVLRNSAGWCKFRAVLKGAYADLELLDGEVLRGEIRTVNRGFNAVIEALVHATRFVILKGENKRKELLEKILYYKEIAEKCGGEKEKKAFKVIMDRLR